MAKKIKSTTKKQKLSECCKAPMLGGVQCENCGSNGKFTTGTAIIKRMDKIIKSLSGIKYIDFEALTKKNLWHLPSVPYYQRPEKDECMVCKNAEKEKIFINERGVGILCCESCFNKLTNIKEKNPTERFIDNGDGTISDTRVLPNGKRLMWQKQGSQERLTYAKAEEFVTELNKEQYPDWRIPTREELESILDLTKHDPAIDPIFKCESAGYWSSTPSADFTNYAWIVDFYYGYVSGYSRYYSNLVRPVRQY